MTIAILKLEAGQKIPRPYNRACSVAEVAEMLACFQATKQKATHKAVQNFMSFCRENPQVIVKADCLDTDKPVAEIHDAKFYAFTEQ